MTGLNHGVVGDGKILALIAPDSGVDWLCLPRFDSASVFARLLDQKRGGTFRVLGRPVSQVYVPDTNVMLTELAVEGGRITITDFCAGGRFYRRIAATAGGGVGPVHASVEFNPRPDYARAEPSLERTPGGVRVDGEITLFTDCADALIAGRPIDFSTARDFVLGSGPVVDLDLALARRLTVDARYARRVPPSVRRAALVLRAHTWRASGAIVAAATTSVPSAVDPPRIGDDRCCRIRDGVWAAEALLRLGDTRTASRFLTWMQQAVGVDRPQPVYAVDGERDLTESVLPHLAGFAGAGPVRVGNRAAVQTENDSYGRMIWLAERCAAAGVELSHAQYRWLAVQADQALEVGDSPNTSNQLWRWVALDRMARLGADRDDPRQQDWAAAGHALRDTIVGAAQAAGFFAQTLEGEAIDASSLRVASMGLVKGDDPLFMATVERCEVELAVDGLMRRSAEDTGASSLCTLWWAEALAMSGQHERGAAVLARLRTHANVLGLFAEDIEFGTGRLLGNFPRVSAHAALITATLALS